MSVSPEMNRISAYKGAVVSVLSAGLAKGHNGNPAAGLRVHQLYAIPCFFSGLAALVLSEPEVNIIEQQHHRMLERVQKLHDRTPRCFVYLLAGTVPARALLHLKQLSLFMMICHLPGNPIYNHAVNILTSAPKSSKSWFLQIRGICLMYRLSHPLHLLQYPPDKKEFKILTKESITRYWEAVLREEAATLSSLKFFAAPSCSLSSVHPVWLAAGSNSFEIRKTEILVRMASGRFRTEYLCRHWSENRDGYCQAITCTQVVGDLEHLLVHCPALAEDRNRLWDMFFTKSMRFPALIDLLCLIEKSTGIVQLQFLLDPFAFSQVFDLWNLFGQGVINHIFYLTRTYVYYLYRRKQIIIGSWQ